MIFVTVGTHEAPFDRLIREIDKLVGIKMITEEVVAQIGYGTYIPESIKWKRFYSYDETQELAKNCRILITHGGPSSFVMGLSNNKVPIVVPRRKDMHEHVNDHQVKFCHEVEKRQHNIIVIDNISDLASAIINYDHIVENMSGTLIRNNEKFCSDLELIVKDLIKKGS